MPASRSRLLLAAPLLVSALLAGCGGGADDEPAAGSTGAETAAASPTEGGGAEAGGGDNGVADKEPDAILADAKAALDATEQVRLRGEVQSSGQQLSFDLGFDDSGAAGTVAQGEQAVELISTGGKTWIQLTDEFLAGQGVGEQAAGLFRGKWFLVPAEQQSQFATFTDKATLVDQVLTPQGSVTKGEPGEVDGTPAVPLQSGSGASSGSLWIATEGEPLPLRLEPDGARTDSGQLDFVYDEEVTVEAPPAGDVVDLAALQDATGGGGGG